MRVPHAGRAQEGVWVPLVWETEGGPSFAVPPLSSLRAGWQGDLGDVPELSGAVGPCRSAWLH